MAKPSTFPSGSSEGSAGNTNPAVTNPIISGRGSHGAPRELPNPGNPGGISLWGSLSSDRHQLKAGFEAELSDREIKTGGFRPGAGKSGNDESTSLFPTERDENIPKRPRQQLRVAAFPAKPKPEAGIGMECGISARGAASRPAERSHVPRILQERHFGAGKPFPAWKSLDSRGRARIWNVPSSLGFSPWHPVLAEPNSQEGPGTMIPDCGSCLRSWELGKPFPAAPDPGNKTWSASRPSFPSRLATSTWREPGRSFHGIVSSGRAASRTTLGISAASLFLAQGSAESWGRVGMSGTGTSSAGTGKLGKGKSCSKRGKILIRAGKIPSDVGGMRDGFSLHPTPFPVGKKSSQGCSARSGGKIFLDCFPTIGSDPCEPTLGIPGSFSKRDEPPQVMDVPPHSMECTEALPIPGPKHSWTASLTSALIPIYPHWKSQEVFPNGMSPSRVADSNPSFHGKHGSSARSGAQPFLDFSPQSAPCEPTLETPGSFSQRDESSRVLTSKPSFQGIPRSRCRAEPAAQPRHAASAGYF